MMMGTMIRMGRVNDDDDDDDDDKADDPNEVVPTYQVIPSYDWL